MPYFSQVLTYQTSGSKLAFRQRSIKTPLDSCCIVVRVTCVSLNSLDAARKALTWFPWIGGHSVAQEFSGTVEISGEHSGFNTGDRVCGYVHSWDGSFVGTYALINVKKNIVSKVPDRLSDAEAASIPRAFAQAESVLRKLRPNRHSRLLVIDATTPMGLLTIQLAKLEYNVEFVAAIGEGSGWLRQIGADIVCSHDDVAICCPSGFTMVVDTCGSGFKSEIPVGIYYSTKAEVSYSSRVQLPIQLIHWLFSESNYSGLELTRFFDRHTSAKGLLDYVYGVDELNQAWGRMIDGSHHKVVIRLAH